jgi:GNAT superfamily N-acetyltransferase
LYEEKDDMKWQRNGVTIVDDRSQLDLEVVYNLLKDAYWTKGRSKEIMAQAFEYSLCFSVFKDNQQIGFARVVTDYATFSWIADVIIDPRFRGQGIGKFLMQCVTEHPAITSITQTLRTRDAHGLYEQFHFERSEFMIRTS